MNPQQAGMDEYDIWWRHNYAHSENRDNRMLLKWLTVTQRVANEISQRIHENLDEKIEQKYFFFI